jgi:hypothetical protein
MPGFKQPPDNTIDGAGGLRPYITRFYEKKGVSHDLDTEVIPMFNNNDIPLARRLRKLDVSKTAFKNWETYYNQHRE